MRKKLEKEKEKYLKLRDKASKNWKTQEFYYYQGKVDLIDELLTNPYWGL